MSGEDAGMSASDPYLNTTKTGTHWWRQKGHLAKIATMHYKLSHFMQQHVITCVNDGVCDVNRLTVMEEVMFCYCSSVCLLV